MRGAFFCVTVDPADEGTAGFVLDWIRVMAARLDSLDVIALETHPATLPSNVRVLSLGKEMGLNRPRLFINSQKHLLTALDRADFLFCHMMPLYVLVSMPVARLRSKPIILWYTHNQTDLKLKMAVKIVDLVFSASEETMNVPTSKKRVFGHGIDTERFYPGPLREDQGPLKVVSIGRLSPRKRIEALIGAAEAIKDKGQIDRFRFILFGQEGRPEQQGYVRELQDHIRRSGLEEVFHFKGAVPFSQVLNCYHQADIFVSTQLTTGLDKAVLEAGACGLPVVACHSSFAPLLTDQAELLFCPGGDPNLLARRLLRLAEFNPQQRREIGLKLRDRVRKGHDLGRLMDKIIDQIEMLVA
jgi:glycosyltransferase involved in cell wall biosynthesis